jgi:hypothetical protein
LMPDKGAQERGHCFAPKKDGGVFNADPQGLCV